MLICLHKLGALKGIENQSLLRISVKADNIWIHNRVSDYIEMTLQDFPTATL